MDLLTGLYGAFKVSIYTGSWYTGLREDASLLTGPSSRRRTTWASAKGGDEVVFVQRAPVPLGLLLRRGSLI